MFFKECSRMVIIRRTGEKKEVGNIGAWVLRVNRSKLSCSITEWGDCGLELTVLLM